MNRRQVLLGIGATAIVGSGTAYATLLQMGSMDEYNASVGATRAVLSTRPAMRDLIRQATLAPNGHNTQPWKFRLGERGIEILPDLARRTPVVDPDDHHIFVSLGCAGANLALAAAAAGRAGNLAFNPMGGGSVGFTFETGTAQGADLASAIVHRQSTRGDYDGRPVAAADLRRLAQAAAVPGVDTVLITDRRQIDGVRDLVVAGNRVQLADPAFMRELKSWMRFSPRQAAAAGDGLFSAASGSPALPAWLGPLMFDMAFTAEAENAKYVRQLRTSAGVAVFVSERDDKEHWVAAGRACERFALQATALGIKCAFINQPVEVARLRPGLATLVGLPGRRPDIVMRFGYGPALPFSARRPVEAVLA